MNVTALPIEGVFVLDPRVFPDERGEFFELFKASAFAAATAHNVRTGRLPVPARLRGIASYGPIVVTVWLVVIAGLIVIQFWDYWVTLGN